MNKGLVRICVLLSIVVVVFAYPWSALSRNIFVGMSAPLTGSSKNLGISMRNGVNLYFKKFNDTENKYKLYLVALDDSYEPYLTRKNMMTFIKNKQIIATIGNVGTPTAVVSITLSNEFNLLLFGPFTGASILRKFPPDKYVINFRASYQQEINRIFKHILSEKIPFTKVALIIQNDAFGFAVLRSVFRALKLYGASDDVLRNIIITYFPRNTTNMKNALKIIYEKDPSHSIQAFIIVGTYRPAALLIKSLEQKYNSANFYNISFVGGKFLKNELCRNGSSQCLKKGINVYLTQVVPSLADKNSAVVKEYLRALKKYEPNLQPNAVSLEGYVIAKIFTTALLSIKGEPTRESIVEALQRIKNLDIGLGVPITIDKSRHQAIDKVWFFKLKHGEWQEE